MTSLFKDLLAYNLRQLKSLLDGSCQAPPQHPSPYGQYAAGPAAYTAGACPSSQVLEQQQQQQRETAIHHETQLRREFYGFCPQQQQQVPGGEVWAGQGLRQRRRAPVGYPPVSAAAAAAAVRPAAQREYAEEEEEEEEEEEQSPPVMPPRPGMVGRRREGLPPAYGSLGVGLSSSSGGAGTSGGGVVFAQQQQQQQVLVQGHETVGGLDGAAGGKGSRKVERIGKLLKKMEYFI